MLGLAAALLLTPVQAAPAGPRLVSYDEAVLCAGLTQAASELEGGESEDGRALYDAALFWSLSAMQAGQAAGKSGTAAEADQNRARIDGVRRLSAGSDEARATLARCRARTPDLG